MIEGRRGRRDGWIGSPTQWTWIPESSGRWWRSQRVGHDWVTEQQQQKVMQRKFEVELFAPCPWADKKTLHLRIGTGKKCKTKEKLMLSFHWRPPPLPGAHWRPRFPDQWKHWNVNTPPSCPTPWWPNLEKPPDRVVFNQVRLNAI